MMMDEQGVVIEATDDRFMTIVNENGDESSDVRAELAFPPVMPKPFITGETLKWQYPYAQPRFIRHKVRKVMNKVRDINNKVVRDEHGKAVLVEMHVPAYTQIVWPR